jgi:hypothetical protein
MFINILLFSIYWAAGKGYILLEPETHSIFMSRIGNVWDILHIPVNGTLGWLLFPYFEAHNWSLSFIVYVLLCFLQMFLVGMFAAIALKKYLNRQRLSDEM